MAGRLGAGDGLGGALLGDHGDAVRGLHFLVVGSVWDRGTTVRPVICREALPLHRGHEELLPGWARKPDGGWAYGLTSGRSYANMLDTCRGSSAW